MRDSGPRILMIVNSFPESQPQVQNTQPAGETPDESAGNEIAKIGRGQQERIIGPARGPGKYDQQHPKRGAQGDEQQRPEPKKPQFDGAGNSRHRSQRRPGRISGNGRRIVRCSRRRRRRLNAQYGLLAQRHYMAVCSNPSGYFTA